MHENVQIGRNGKFGGESVGSWEALNRGFRKRFWFYNL